jgi:lipopolysaccharide biosynthesis protein
MLNTRAIAFYLPQFHPIPENDLWWGKGFTEWTNTAKAQPMFRSHYQPHIPADLGFYDLRVPETRIQQAEMAAAHGIEGFCYYHYWFAGRRILERPFNEVIASSSPDFPFCLCWANETWSGIWHGVPKKILIEQTYPGEADHRAHFAALLPAFRDPRYIRVDGKPVFVIYQPLRLPDISDTLRLWRAMADEAGLPGLHLVAYSLEPETNPASFGYDAIIHGHNFKQHQWRNDWRNPVARIRQKIDHRRGLPHVHDYADLAASQMEARAGDNVYRCVVHAWDNTPRSGRNGVAYKNPDPELFRKVLGANVAAMSNRPVEHRLLFLKSWNEWAEGNHLEPDLRYGMTYLQIVADVVRGSAAPST